MPSSPAPSLPASPKAVLIDLAGVLHVGDQAIPGAVDALARLRAAGIPLRFLTNTTTSGSGSLGPISAAMSGCTSQWGRRPRACTS